MGMAVAAVAWGGPWPRLEAREVHLDPTLLTWGGLVAVLVFSWAYRAADGRRHDFTFLNQGTFFLKWGTFFLLFLTFPYFLYTLERQKKKGKRTAAKRKD